MIFLRKILLKTQAQKSPLRFTIYENEMKNYEMNEKLLYYKLFI